MMMMMMRCVKCKTVALRVRVWTPNLVSFGPRSSKLLAVRIEKVAEYDEKPRFET